jgi:NADH-ubiquinone oxidoreductase chain 4
LGARFAVSNLFAFYILFELSLVPILLMIIFWGRQPERLSAGLYFLIYTRSFSIPFIVVIIAVYPQIYFFFLGSRLSTSSWLGIFLIIPFLVKIPIIGLHFWLPKAHVEARTRGSMILAGLLLKLGRYGALRVVLIFNISYVK